jgi:hypothetical protein
MQIGQEQYEALTKRANTIIKLDLKGIRGWLRAEIQTCARDGERANRPPEVSAKLEIDTPGSFEASGASL